MPVQGPQKFADIIALPEAKLQADAILAAQYIFTSFASDEDLSKFIL